ncbi:MAG: HIT domain-containing protein [Chloroflexota bacterium]|nr:HIT domain-containing protein [Chloroflexota bacterium]
MGSTMDDDQTIDVRSERHEGRVAPHDRLWTPWRMRYIAGGAGEEGCIFCNRRDADDDTAALVLYRGRLAYVIMNLFPYNTGHVMMVPNAHGDTLERVPPGALVEMAALAPSVTTALRRVLRCDGFNIGLNIGAISGAGVAEHLHQHVVPRWRGDANFMPILASTMVLPELIPVTYAKVRAELERELLDARQILVVTLTEEDRVVLLHDNRLPDATAVPDTPLWRSAIDAVVEIASDVEVAGWAGERYSGERDTIAPPALVIRVRSARAAPRWRAVPVTEVLEGQDESLRETVRRALHAVAP